MTLLYALSNICVPFGVMIVATLKRRGETASPQYGKWALLFALTFIFNAFIVLKSNFITTIDLVAKLIACLLPPSANALIEKFITGLHLEGVLMWLRITTINMVFRLNSMLTLFFVGQLQPSQRQQVQSVLIQLLQSDQQQMHHQLQTAEKMYEHAGVNCTIITEHTVQMAQSKLKLLSQEKSAVGLKPSAKLQHSLRNTKVRDDPISQPSINIKKVENGRENRLMQSQSQKEMDTSQVRSVSPTSSIHNLKQSEFSEDDLQDSDDIDSIQQGKKEEKPKKTKMISAGQYRSQDQSSKIVKVHYETKRRNVASPRKRRANRLRRTNTDASDLGIKQSEHAISDQGESPQISPTSKLVNKLDVSVSEYSDMFDDEDEEEKQIVCKVEAIVEIGSGSNLTLSIHSLQLYSNRELRILTTVGEEVETHTLVSVVKAPNSFYQLRLKNGPVTRRRVKFRGQYQPFMRYLKQHITPT